MPLDSNMTNTVYSFPHIEDYIEIISGYRKPDGSNNHSIFLVPEALINLARYDVKVIESFASQSQNNIGYTDRQAVLARDLVLKYDRQLFKHQVDITPIKTNPQFRLPLRTIDRTSRIWVEDNQIKIRFPYDNTTIELIRDQSKEGKGSIKFNREKRIWEAALTEYNVNWVYTFSKTHKFEIDSSLQQVMNLILEVEKKPYSIELFYSDNKVWLTNGTDSLLEYMAINLGGFRPENILRLIDWAPILGYTVAKDIEETVINELGTRFWSLCANRELKVDLNNSYSDQIEEIVKYAQATERFPIYVYEPDLSDRLTMLFMRHFLKDEIVNLDSHGVINEKTKLVYTRKIPKAQVNTIPLLISSSGMLFGGDRQVWIQTADKVVYFTKDVYNKNVKKGQEVCKLN